MAKTLFDYYKSQGKPLPSMTERASLAAQQGIANYTGTSEQNTALLSKLTAKTVGSGALPAGSLPAGGLTPPEDQGTQPVNDFGNMRVALRSALSEAAQNTARNRMEQLSGLVGGGAAPSVFLAAIGLAQGGLRQTQESVFSDVIAQYKDASEAQRKRLEFNPDQFRSAQGGIYDLKNNTWVINPKSGGTGSIGKGLLSVSGQTILTETKQVIDGFRSIDEFTPSEKGKVLSDLYALGYNSKKTPDWFSKKVQSERLQSLLPEMVQEEWDNHRSFTLHGKKLSATSIKELYDDKEFEKHAKKSKMTVEEYMQYLNKTIEAYRGYGFSDAEIIKQMTK